MFATASKLPLAAAALLLGCGLALAQAPSPAPSTGASTTTKAPVKARKQATTPEGIECSSQADAKNLKGKERRSFRSKCIAGLKKAKGAPKASAKGSGSGSAPK